MRTARDPSLPHPLPTTLAEADALASVVDDIAAAFPPHSGSLPRTPAPVPARALGVAEAADEERLLLATAAAHPSDVAQMRWLSSTDFTHPLHTALWQCVTALVRRHAPVDPVTVLWEAQQRGLLDTGPEPREPLGVLSQPAGSPEHWGEHILNRSVLATAHHTGPLIHAFTDEKANTPYQLVVGSRRALADLTAIRTRWHHATSPTPSPAATPARAKATAAPRAGPPKTTAPRQRASPADPVPAGDRPEVAGRRKKRAPPFVTTPSTDAHALFDTHPAHPSTVTAILTGARPSNKESDPPGVAHTVPMGSLLNALLAVSITAPPRGQGRPSIVCDIVVAGRAHRAM